MGKGLALITEDGAVSGAGVPVVVYGIHILSGAGGNAVVALRHGSTVSGSVAIQHTGTASTGATFTFPEGVVFSSGCFVDVDTNTVSVAVWFEKV